MSRLGDLSREIASAEEMLQQRRLLVSLRTRLVATQARRRLASPVALLAAAGAGFVLGSRKGRSGVVRLFGVLQLGLAALSAAAAAK
jgi:hypothetical protein